MEMIRGRTLSEVRRYDLWKLLIAALLFVNALFICGKPAPDAQAPKVATPEAIKADAPKLDAPKAVPAASLLAAGYAWAGDKLLLTGNVRDEATRKAIVDEAVKTMGSADKVVDQLKIDASAPALSWQTRLADVLGWGKAKGEGGIKVDDKLVVLTGKVPSEADKKARGDLAASVFGAEYKIDNRLLVDAPAPLAIAKPPNAKLYFANNKTDVPAEASKALSEVIAWAKLAPANKLAISGYHSATGSAERNHELAKGRASEVAGILKHAGVPDAQIELRKPVQELGGIDPAQARRVEVGPAQ
jgi:outer membrane protein OmpA-like peptidoglycan-associated protein